MSSDPAKQGPEEANAIRRMLADGLTAMALDRVRQITNEEGERATPDVLFLGALASARMGAGSEAQAWLERIDTQRIEDAALAVDVWSLAGRIAKDSYASRRSTSPEAASAHAAIALEHYRRAYEVSGAYYPAVNAATMAYLLGKADDSSMLASRAALDMLEPARAISCVRYSFSKCATSFSFARWKLSVMMLTGNPVAVAGVDAASSYCGTSSG